MIHRPPLPANHFGHAIAPFAGSPGADGGPAIAYSRDRHRPVPSSRNSGFSFRFEGPSDCSIRWSIFISAIPPRYAKSIRANSVTAITIMTNAVEVNRIFDSPPNTELWRAFPPNLYRRSEIRHHDDTGSIGRKNRRKDLHWTFGRPRPAENGNAGLTSCWGGSAYHHHRRGGAVGLCR